jgi:hypothetical protein
VFFCASLTHPCSRTICAPALKRGIYIRKKILPNSFADYTNKMRDLSFMLTLRLRRQSVFVKNKQVMDILKPKNR